MLRIQCCFRCCTSSSDCMYLNRSYIYQTLSKELILSVCLPVDVLNLSMLNDFRTYYICIYIKEDKRTKYFIKVNTVNKNLILIEILFFRKQTNNYIYLTFFLNHQNVILHNQKYHQIYRF